MQKSQEMISLSEQEFPIQTPDLNVVMHLEKSEAFYRSVFGSAPVSATI
jgi:hypothetical protein